jgi:hypothetical protein
MYYYMLLNMTEVPAPFLIKMVDGVFQGAVIIHLIPVGMQADTIIGYSRNACGI